jgi:hypothetical protein
MEIIEYPISNTPVCVFAQADGYWKFLVGCSNEFIFPSLDRYALTPRAG